MWIPTALYERLPLVYFGSAAASLALLGGSRVAVISATLLCVAAVLTVRARRNARQPVPHQRPRTHAMREGPLAPRVAPRSASRAAPKNDWDAPRRASPPPDLARPSGSAQFRGPSGRDAKATHSRSLLSSTGSGPSAGRPKPQR